MKRAAVLVVVIAGAVVVGRVRSAKAPVIGHPASPLEKIELSATIAGHEVEWNNLSQESFPRDHWSARDDFHAKEGSFIEEASRTTKVRLEDVLRAIDEDIHDNGGEGRNANVVPCKPRAFYD